MKEVHLCLIGCVTYFSFAHEKINFLPLLLVKSFLISRGLLFHLQGYTWRSFKGQLISKCPFGVFKLTKRISALASKGQLISKIEPKKQTKYFCISALKYIVGSNPTRGSIFSLHFFFLLKCLVIYFIQIDKLMYYNIWKR